MRLPVYHATVALLAIAITLSPMFGAARAASTVVLGNPTPPAIPTIPFYANLTVLNSPVSAGKGLRALAISNIVLTNFDTNAQQVFIFAPIFASGGSCGDPVTGGSSPRLYVYLQPHQTLVIPYPTPLVVDHLHPNCIGAEVTTLLTGGSVEMDVTGYLQ